MLLGEEQKCSVYVLQERVMGGGRGFLKLERLTMNQYGLIGIKSLPDLELKKKQSALSCSNREVITFPGWPRARRIEWLVWYSAPTPVHSSSLPHSP